MTAYVISEVEILDEERGQLYRDLAEASITRYGGRYLVRGAQPQVPEGEWSPDERVVIVEFPSMERLREWYASPEYAEALKVGQTALARRLMFVSGWDRGKEQWDRGEGTAGPGERTAGPGEGTAES